MNRHLTKSIALIVVATLITTVTVAETLVAKGTKAVLTVDYEYVSNGKDGPGKNGSNNDWHDWSIHNTVHLVAQYRADAPQPFGAMHGNDARQQSDIGQLQKRASAAQQKMQPTMADMMAIVEKCGETNEACISKAVTEYGLNMQVTPEMKSAQKDIAAMPNTGGARFQLWQLISQSGNYAVNELRRKQVFEMTCTAVKVCKREETRTASGEIPPPANGKSPAGSSMYEVDATNRDLIIALPVPLAPLRCRQTIVTSVPGEKSAASDTVCTLPLSQAIKPMTVSIPGDLRSVSGTKTFSIEGRDAAGGTLTVKWKFESQHQ